MTRRRIALPGLVTVFLVPMLLAGCAEERSAEKYCSTAKEQQDRLGAKYQAQADKIGSSSDPLSGLVGGIAMLAEAQGDLVVYFDKLDQVAPNDIEPDVGAVHDAFEQQAEATRNMASDPLGSLGGSVLGALQSAGAMDRVDSYTRTTCGFPI